MLPLLLLLGCISKGDYELLQVQLDATRTALSAKNAACFNAYCERDERIARLEAELGAARASGAALDERLQTLLAELEDARARLAALAAGCLVPVPGPKAPPVVPLVTATAEDLGEALALRSRASFERERRLQAFAAVEAAFLGPRGEGRLEVLEEGGHAVVRIPAVQLFNEGQAMISPRGEVLLQDLADALRTLPPGRVLVAAHTDDRPYHSAEHASLWELGFDHAMSVLRALQEAGAPQVLSAASCADSEPIGDNATPEGRRANYRIELVFAE
jgi:chemotaxis protein MotB